jgi:transcriptional regulator with XRE-family HTH domain
MGKSTAIPDFAAKLGLVLDSLNWSRALLAQKVGVDKSVAQRWASGQMVPGGASLVALTAAIQRVVPGFTRGDWRLPVERFAARLGGAAGPAACPAATLFPQAAVKAATAPEAAAGRYGGFWLLVHASVQAPEAPGAVGYLAGVVPRPGMLWMTAEGSLQGTWRGEGPVFALHRLLYLVLEDVVQGDSFAFAVLNGVALGKAMVLDGVASSAASSLRGPVAATRIIGLRLDDAPDPPWRAEALRRLVRLNAEGLLPHLPAPVSTRLAREALPGRRSSVLTVPAEGSLACEDDEIAQGLAPEGAAAVAAARALFGC